MFLPFSQIKLYLLNKCFSRFWKETDMFQSKSFMLSPLIISLRLSPNYLIKALPLQGSSLPSYPNNLVRRCLLIKMFFLMNIFMSSFMWYSFQILLHLTCKSLISNKSLISKYSTKPT